MHDGKVFLLTRCEDNPKAHLGGRTSRIGLASSTDGIHFEYYPTPVLYPDNDVFAKYDHMGGCEDPRVVQTEEGLFVMGIGKAHTPEAFVKACENFTYTEILAPKQKRIEKPVEKTQTAGSSAHKAPSKPARQVPQEVKKGLTNVITKAPIDMGIINSAFDMVFDDISGLAMASQLGAALKKVDPTFDIRSYGHTSFSKFIEALKPQFEIVVRKDKQGQTVMVKRNK